MLSPRLARSLAKVCLVTILLYKWRSPLKSLFVGEDCQDDSLESLNGELADGQDLAVREDVEVCDYYLPDVVDTRNINQGGLDETSHGKRIDVAEDLALS